MANDKPETLVRIQAALAVAALTALAGWLGLNQSGGALQTLSYDMPFLLHRAGGANDIRLVYMDQFEGGLLDRRVQVPLLDKLRESGARAVLYDVIFDQPFPDPAVDEAFAAAIRRFRGVDEENRPLSGQPRGLAFLACGRENVNQTGAMGERLIPPIDTLLDAADDFGLVVLHPEDSHFVRELKTGTPDEPSMTWKAAVALGAPLGEETRGLERWINYAGPPPDPQVPDSQPAILSFSARAVLDDMVPALLRDKIIIIGGQPGIAGEALGKDLFNTPFHRLAHRGGLPYMSGVEVQANLLANLLEGRWLTRSTHTSDLALVLGAGLALGLGLTLLRPGRAWLAALLAVAALALAGAWTVVQYRFWFPWSVAAFLQVPVALIGGVGAHFYIERHFRLKLSAEQKRLREAFARYLSPPMLDQLTTTGFHTQLGGEEVEAAMMFTDIESFTEMCQRVGHPKRIVETINDYFARTTGHIFDHDGVIIKFIGDAIFAAWGAPLADQDAAAKAARAAWKLSQSDQLRVEGMVLRTRIGIHYGKVVAGNVGTEQHVDYTLIGDAVNLSSRLEGLNKALETHILVSGELRERLGPEFRCRRVGRFLVKGRSEVTEVFELLGPALSAEEPPWITRYHEALMALEADDPKRAAPLLETVIALRSDLGDGPSSYLLERIKAHDLLDGGVVEMREK